MADDKIIVKSAKDEKRKRRSSPKKRKKGDNSLDWYNAEQYYEMLRSFRLVFILNSAAAYSLVAATGAGLLTLDGTVLSVLVGAANATPIVVALAKKSPRA
ncbi:MAG: hypothetical protein MPL62_15435 [Alphaproteobacteria bacterium]|nr:hypothetical protein [Alphaproteobacteria bacterium]